MHLRQPTAFGKSRFTYHASEPFTKKRKNTKI